MGVELRNHVLIDCPWIHMFLSRLQFSYLLKGNGVYHFAGCYKNKVKGNDAISHPRHSSRV